MWSFQASCHVELIEKNKKCDISGDYSYVWRSILLMCFQLMVEEGVEAYDLATMVLSTICVA